MYSRSLFLFHRDLRLQDNTGLIKALEQSELVIPAFIFDDRQLKQNEYRGEHLIQFMTESLEDLDDQLQKKGSKLFVFSGITHEVLESLIEKNKIKAVYSNRDYTPFALKRDGLLQKICAVKQVKWVQTADALLNEPEHVHKDDGTPYTVYTPFMKKSRDIEVQKPRVNQRDNYFSEKIPDDEGVALCQKVLKQKTNDIYVHGGRAEALKILSQIKDFKNYDEERNFPAKQGTTGLSAHNKFGTVSIREVYAAVKKHFGATHTLINELYWRDFFTHINFHFPHVYGHSFHKKYEDLKWSKSKKYFEAWCEGKTGYPIVDAGMRELNTTGYMHNRVRMIVASFLTKNLHIDWRWGEKYFAQQLIDYDPAVNNGNWQWAASTGCDAQPYFRIFNPWLQQKKFDEDCEYIKKWVPELEGCDPKDIHNIFKNDEPLVKNYPMPIVEHKKESALSKEMYKLAVSN